MRLRRRPFQDVLRITGADLAIKVLATLAVRIAGRWLIGRIPVGVAQGGLLAHVAAGAFLLILQPFKVSDFVTAGDIMGTVREIGLFGTTIVTPDNTQTIVGNTRIFSGTTRNFSTLSE